MGITARTEGAFEYFDPKSFPYVVFSAPPSGSVIIRRNQSVGKVDGKNRPLDFASSSSAVFSDNIIVTTIRQR